MVELGAISLTAQAIWSHPTWDLILIAVLLCGGFFYGLFAGKQRIAATIIYTYVALAVFRALPLSIWLKGLGEDEEFFAKAGMFFGTFLLLALILGSGKRKGMAPAGSWWKIFLLSFLQVGLLIHIFLTLIPPGKFEILAPLTKNIFADPSYTLAWLIVPIITVVILRRLEAE